MCIELADCNSFDKYRHIYEIKRGIWNFDGFIVGEFKKGGIFIGDISMCVEIGSYGVVNEPPPPALFNYWELTNQSGSCTDP